MSSQNVVSDLPESIVSTSDIDESTLWPSCLHTPLVMILIAYLLVVLKIGPSLMKSRSAYQLKKFIIVYNIYQICACFYLNYKIFIYELPSFQYGNCIDIQNGTSASRGFDQIANFLLWLKASELSETVVFVLRKKQQQVSFLHVFHHGAMLFLSYNMEYIYRNSAALFPIFLNCCVHIVMYSYYLLAAVLPRESVARLTPVKKSITIMQMVQFTIILFQIVVAKSVYGCKIPEVMLMIYTIIIVVIFYGFYDFYKKSYFANKKN